MKDEETEIIMDGCIRCGVCHDICPQDAVRHDSEKTTERIDSNVETTKKYMELCAEHLGDENEKAKCLKRMIKYFNNQKVIAVKTLDILEKLQQAI
jgi:Fe-S-cluster-containing hydrogenase component 2